MTEDDNYLYDVASAGLEGRAANSPTERDSYYRLHKKGDVERIPITPMAGDDPSACRITERGKQYLHQLPSTGQ